MIHTCINTRGGVRENDTCRWVAAIKPIYQVGKDPAS